MVKKNEPTGTEIDYPDSKKAKNFRDKILALRQSGIGLKEIAETTGLPVGTVKVWIARWGKQERKTDEDSALELMEADAAESGAKSEKEDEVFEQESANVEVLDGTVKRGPGRPAGRSNRKADGTLDTSNAERKLETAVTAAARTVRRAAAGVKVEAQSLAAAKLILKKYGLLQEEDYTKESQYAKMTNEELADRALAAVAILLRKRDRVDLAQVIEEAKAKLSDVISRESKDKTLEAT
jgi:hypothetical protein